MSENSALAQFCVDLTARASEGFIDPIFGRDSEVKRVVEILCRRTKNSPILIGESGVGKTAIAEGLALSIAQADAPFVLLVRFLIVACYFTVVFTYSLLTFTFSFDLV